MRSYRDLIVWQKAMDLVDAIYDETEQWPREERYGLIGQVRRAIVSVPSNIANGSLYEAETQLLIAHRRSWVDKPTCDAFLTRTAEVSRLIYGLMRRLEALPDRSDASRLTPHA